MNADQSNYPVILFPRRWTKEKQKPPRLIFFSLFWPLQIYHVGKRGHFLGDNSDDRAAAYILLINGLVMSLRHVYFRNTKLNIFSFSWDLTRQISP